MIPDIANAIFPPILRGIECVLEPLGYAVIMVNTDSLSSRESPLVDVLRDDPKIIEVARAGTPVVTVNRKIEAEGWRCAEQLLDGWNPAAILCANDRLALRVIQFLKDRGIDCPGQVCVTGYNDMPYLDRLRPGLTTVRIELFGVGPGKCPPFGAHDDRPRGNGPA